MFKIISYFIFFVVFIYVYILYQSKSSSKLCQKKKLSLLKSKICPNVKDKELNKVFLKDKSII